MSRTTQVLLSLIGGLAAGAAIATSGSAALAAVSGAIEPVGVLWVNALRMIVIPLVGSAIVIGINSLPDPKHVGRIGARALAVFLIALAAAATFATTVGPMVFSRLTIDPAAALALRATAPAGELARAPEGLSMGRWLAELVPPNIVKAAADGAMLQLIVFTVLLGVAIAMLDDSRREPLLRAARSVYAATLILVHWILAVAPFGVFALSLTLATKLGIGAAGAIAFYVGAVSAMTIAFALLFYLAAAVVGGRSLLAFSRACAPAQAVALSSRSSLASLPALLDGADSVLHLPPAIRSFLLPLAASTFRPGGAIAVPMGVLFTARLYGVELAPAQLATVAFASILTALSAPGIPGGSVLIMVPVMLLAGLPADAVGLLIAVDTIPDMVRTVTNVTGDMATATILARFESN